MAERRKAAPAMPEKRAFRTSLEGFCKRWSLDKKGRPWCFLGTRAFIAAQQGGDISGQATLACSMMGRW